MKIPKSKRARRVGVELQKVISEVLIRELPALSGALVTIPEVRVSDDLAHAAIFASIHNVDDPGEVQKALIKLLPTLRREAAQKIRIKKLPEFRFVWDDTMERADRIEQLLNQIRSSSSDSGEDDDEQR